MNFIKKISKRLKFLKKSEEKEKDLKLDYKREEMGKYKVKYAFTFSHFLLLFCLTSTLIFSFSCTLIQLASYS